MEYSRLDLQHDLRTPVGIIAGYGQMIEDGDLNTEEIRLAVIEVCKQARQLNQAIDYILEQLEQEDDYTKPGTRIKIRRHTASRNLYKDRGAERRCAATC